MSSSLLMLFNPLIDYEELEEGFIRTSDGSGAGNILISDAPNAGKLLAKDVQANEA
jgi:hypothetical protein